MQSDVTISTNEKDLKVIYGSKGIFTFEEYTADDEDFYTEELESALHSLKYILTDLNDIKKSYIRLGFHLKEFFVNCYYLDFGYDSLGEFCEANLGMDKSAVSRCISVFENFCAVENHTRKMWIDDKYKDYSYSQLCEMVSMDDEQREQVKPNMTIKQIREIKKNAKGKTDYINERDVSQVATSQPDLLQLKKFDYDEFVNKQGIVLYNYIKSLTYYSTRGLTLFDQNGKEIYHGIIECLYEGIGGMYIRLRDDGKDLSAMMERSE